MRLGRLTALPVLLAVVAAVTAVPARAQTSNADRQKQLKQQILEVSNAQTAASQTLQEIRTRKGMIDTRVAQLDTQLSDAIAKIAPLEAEAARLAGVLQEAQAKLAATQAKLEAAKTEVRDSAAGIYRSARSGATYDYLSAQRPMGLVQGSKYLADVNHKQRNTVRQISTLRDEIDAQRRTIQTSKEQADAATDEARRTRDQITSMRSEIEPARAEAAAQAQAEEVQVALLAAKKAQDEKELQAVSDAIAAELRRQQAIAEEARRQQAIADELRRQQSIAASATPNSGASPPPNIAPSRPASSGGSGGCDARPAAGAIVSGFGPRGGALHAGVDFGAPMGAPIYACWAGRVVSAGWQGGYGNAVVIDHGGGKATLYAHQSRIAVSAGQNVNAGSVIGYVGSTGDSTGPHLHFEVRINGSPVNPAPYL
jgi:murein DD-endopeptidase MepM/ murein hydrolase activator NlpD